MASRDLFLVCFPQSDFGRFILSIGNGNKRSYNNCNFYNFYISMNDKKSKFGLGVLIGTIIGGITALFLSPKSGEENREIVVKKVQELKKLLEEKEVDTKVKEIYGEVNEEAKDIYFKVKDWLIEELSQLKEKVEEIDKEKYEKAVQKVLKRVQKETKKGAKELEKVKKQLTQEWKRLKK
ncbi:hypothetical protein COY89_01620 [Candidatus Roizmanbacteria bacterium CG_4_10_14_0_8_um_filter_36_36]|uniref:Gas vesicle protein n=2 Tax=Candidatus Roizmaniibacteriota TaxID=1752723 RepID=A0A2M8KM46_9BACT|nr:MAG: hypothetical protein COS51_00685 [Candidatus Roizmanbacteria bacterium CG03_land_8_20_14_0_80_36_21]PIY70337.1 MAG: hypothetical protein COY89_01620 [Candidatus Roizmanbacteria bacterium CG_4_10_14_0_8_um_filter_36_36]PJA53788.1 MAG: hypothetical protein CO166_00565 [Candidatus Roizmanbacteria bacterium CG_4_9_14_3_um_filter_36_11]PJC82249.1 MAG: hypothetical protein CO007_00465 [Candidatus Roizmanbacteria bacterium CG_4_8_14_3_um_filter_36_10]PJE60995.1 MAG: hypothetical protein COU86_